MKAVCFVGPRQVSVEHVPDPHLLLPTDIILRVTSTSICGSDLHVYNGFMPAMAKGDIVGHEFMGEVVEVGADVKRIKAGDRVVVPYNIACGSCFYCARGEFASCENSNPNVMDATVLSGYPAAGLFGSSFLDGGYAGGQAEYVRVPFGDVGPLVVPHDVEDEQVLFLGDVFPAGYMAAENCNIRPEATVAIWGAGPVGQMAALSARLLGAAKVICVDTVPERLHMAEHHAHAVTIDSSAMSAQDVIEVLKEVTGGRGPDAVIDAVGLEAHGAGMLHDPVAERERERGAERELEREVIPHSLEPRETCPDSLATAIHACRPGGTVSIPGTYRGYIDRLPLGAAFAKGLTFRMGQTHTHRYMQTLLHAILQRDVDPSYIVTHRLSLDEAPRAYRIFNARQDGCVKVVMTPAM